MSDGASTVAHDNPRRSLVSARWMSCVLMALLSLQALLYLDSFQIQPAGDDFAAPLTEIARGETQGPAVFFTLSAQPHNYRPLQSLAMWAFGRISSEHTVVWIRILHFLGMATYAIAGLLWIRAMARSRAAVLCGMIVMLVHPAMVAPLASIDGFSGLFSTGLMWLSVYAVWRWRDRLCIGLTVAIPIFVVALGFKEYSLGAAPLACFAVICFARSTGEGLRKALIVGSCFSMVVIGFILIRSMTIPPPQPGQEVGYFRADPILWAKNAALFAGVLSFPGSSAWVFVERNLAVFGLAAGLSILTVTTLAIGLVASVRMDHADPSRPVGRWLVFSLLGLVGASFPPVIVAHVSEMYAVGMVLPVAMLTTLSAEGLARSGGLERIAAAAFFVTVVSIMTVAVRGKVARIRDAGERAQEQLKMILSRLPADASDTTIAVFYPPRSEYLRYSVFVLPDEIACRHEAALDWLAPNRSLRLAFPLQLHEALAQPEKYGVVLRWNPMLRQMEMVRSAPSVEIQNR